MSLSITPDALERLGQLQQERKFTEEEYYPGAPTEQIRSECEHRVNVFLSDVVRSLRSGTDRHDIFTRARRLIEAFGEDDTEEREKVGDYIAEAMRIIGLTDWTGYV